MDSRLGNHHFSLEQKEKSVTVCDISDFLRPDLGTNNGPFPNKKLAKTSQIVYIIPNFLVLNFGENFMTIRSKVLQY